MNGYVPSEFYLGQNYPNPFKERTTIKYCVAYKSKVRIIVFDSKNKILKKLLDEEKDAGTYEVVFNSHSGEAQNLSSGVYFYQLKAGNFMQTKKMLLLK